MTASVPEPSQAIGLLHGGTSSSRAGDALLPRLGQRYRVFAVLTEVLIDQLISALRRAAKINPSLDVEAAIAMLREV